MNSISFNLPRDQFDFHWVRCKIEKIIIFRSYRELISIHIYIYEKNIYKVCFKDGDIKDFQGDRNFAQTELNIRSLSSLSLWKRLLRENERFDCWF